MNLVAERRWRSLTDGGAEYASLWRSGNGYSLEGMAIRFDEGQWRLDYLILLNDAWFTREVVVRWFHAGDSGTLGLIRDDSGGWSRDGVPDDTLAGCTDVDFGFSPVTNLMPVRRLGSDAGATAEVHAAWLVFPDLEIRPARQTYTRKGAVTVLYESASGFTTEITVDESGFANDYPGLWTARDHAGDT